MIVENINKLNHTARILLAPLDWGLGHATRCIPIIKVLNEHNIEVIIAAEGAVANLLQKEFPATVILPLKGYKINYSRGRQFFFLKMILQFPSVIAVVKNEKRWLKKIIAEYKIDAVISDNRFGLYFSEIPCVYITHQLFIQTGNRFLDKIAQRINYRFINKFDECWVPDAAAMNNLAGKLSHPEKLPKIPVKYLGTVSRCKKMIAEKKYELLVLLSGPEPQRSIFEDILLPQLKTIQGTVVLVRGLPGTGKKLVVENTSLIVHDHLPAEALNKLMQQSVNILARCGYSTIMDLATLQQKAILVPTPGQTEQEYLAAYLMEKHFFYTIPQENFSLLKAIDEAGKFNFAQAGIDGFNKEVVIDWVDALKKKIMVLQ